MLYVVLFLAVACDNATEPPAEGDAPPVTAAPAAPAGPVEAPPGTLHRVDLDVAGGRNGAPLDAMFVLPVGLGATGTMGVLSDGQARGVVLTVPKRGDALVCTVPFPIGSASLFRTRARLAEIQSGTLASDGLNFELRARDASGTLISPATTRYALIENVQSAGDWAEWEAEVATPAGATQGEFCARFVGSTGVVEIDFMEVRPPGTAPGSAAAATTVGALPTVVKRWEFDAAGPAGAPEGFTFIVPPGSKARTTVATFGDAKGFSFGVDKPGNALACSERFAVGGTQTVKARLKLDKVKADARAWTGFVTEVRTWDAGGTLVSPPSGQYTVIDTARTKGAWREIDVPFAAPAGATEGSVCMRFVESTGAASVDWVSVGE